MPLITELGSPMAMQAAKTKEGNQAVLLLTKDFLLVLGKVVFWITAIIFFSLTFLGHSFLHRVPRDQWPTYFSIVLHSLSLGLVKADFWFHVSNTAHCYIQ